MNFPSPSFSGSGSNDNQQQDRGLFGFGHSSNNNNNQHHGQQQAHLASPPPGPPPQFNQQQQQQQQAAPPSGYRVPLTTTSAFPQRELVGQPVSADADGSPIFLGSALMERSVHPCKIAPHLNPHARVPYGGGEHAHHGRYDLLPFDPRQMEWVLTSRGQIPYGRRAVEGGYEEGGQKLYHALARVNGIEVPGKTAEHLGGANVAFGDSEHVVHENYHILCWRY